MTGRSVRHGGWVVICYLELLCGLLSDKKRYRTLFGPCTLLGLIFSFS